MLSLHSTAANRLFTEQSLAPPIFFDCVKENGPCTVQKKPPWPTNSLRPFAAKADVRIRYKLLKAVPIVWRARNRILKKPFTASKRLHKRGAKRILSASFSAAAPPVYGGGIQRRGPAGPFLWIVRGRGGNRQCAASGGCSEPVSRKRHDGRTRSGRESFCRDGDRNRNAPTFLVGHGGVFAPKTSPHKKKEPAFSGWFSFKHHFLSRS